jgi:beta-glucosidase
MGLTSYRFSVEWARIEPEDGQVDPDGLDHYDAMVDGCLERGLSPAITLSHFSSPRWFARAGGWLWPDAPARLADHCQRVMQRIGDRMAVAITLNEPNLPATLLWGGLPTAVIDLQRRTLEAASVAAGVPRFRASNVVLPEERHEIEDGMALGHVAAREAVRAAAPGVPVGMSLAVVEDAAIDEEGAVLRDRKRADCYERWLRLAEGDDFVGVQNYEQIVYAATGMVQARDGEAVNQMGTQVVPESLAGAVRYVHRAGGRPVLVSEHGIATDDDQLSSPRWRVWRAPWPTACPCWAITTGPCSTTSSESSVTPTSWACTPSTAAADGGNRSPAPQRCRERSPGGVPPLATAEDNCPPHPHSAAIQTCWL